MNELHSRLGLSVSDVEKHGMEEAIRRHDRAYSIPYDKKLLFLKKAKGEGDNIEELIASEHKEVRTRYRIRHSSTLYPTLASAQGSKRRHDNTDILVGTSEPVSPNAPPLSWIDYNWSAVPEMHEVRTRYRKHGCDRMFTCLGSIGTYYPSDWCNFLVGVSKPVSKTAPELSCQEYQWSPLAEVQISEGVARSIQTSNLCQEIPLEKSTIHGDALVTGVTNYPEQETKMNKAHLKNTARKMLDTNRSLAERTAYLALGKLAIDAAVSKLPKEVAVLGPLVVAELVAAIPSTNEKVIKAQEAALAYAMYVTINKTVVKDMLDDLTGIAEQAEI